MKALEELGTPTGIITRRSVRQRDVASTTRTLILTLAMLGIVVAFLSPLLQTAIASLRSPQQTAQLHTQFLPSDPVTFEYEGEVYDVYQVPIDGSVRQLALVDKGRQESQFLDPADPAAGLITWQGSWRILEPSWTVAPKWQNYADVWELIKFPRLLFNTVAIAVIGVIGTVVSCTLVAYGFARFRFPGATGALHLAHRDSIPADSRHAHPDLHDLRQARLGGDVAAVARSDVLRERV